MLLRVVRQTLSFFAVVGRERQTVPSFATSWNVDVCLTKALLSIKALIASYRETKQSTANVRFREKVNLVLECVKS